MYNALASFGCSGELWGLRMNRGVLLVLLVLLLLLLQQAQALPFVEGLGTSITAAAVGGTHQGAQNAVYAHLGEGAAVKGSIQGPDYEHGQPFSNYSNSRQLQWASAGPLGRRRRSPNDVTAVAVAALLGVVVLLLSCGVSILRSAKATQAWATERHLASGVGKGLCEQTTTAKEGAHEEGTAEVAAGGRGEVAAAEGRGGQEVSISAPGSSSVNPVAVPLIRTVSVSEREGAGERKRSAGRDLGELAVPFLKRAASSECSGTTAGGAVAAEAATTPEIEEEGVSSRRTGGSETIPTPAGVSSSLDPMAVPFVPRGFVSEGDGAGEKHRTAGRGRKAPASTSLEPVAPPAQSAEAPEGHATREATAAEAKAAAGVATSGVKKKVPRPPLLWGVGADNVIGQYPSVGTYLYRIQQLGSYCRLHLEFLPRGQARQTAQLLVRYGVLEIGALTPYCADKEEYIRQRAIDAFCRLAMAFGARLQKHLAAASSFDNLMHALYLLKARRSFPSCGVQGRPHANKHVLPAAGAALRQMATAVNMLLQSVESIPSAAPSPVGATQTAVMAAVIEERVLQMLSESLAAQSLQCLQIQCPPGAIVSHADVILSQARYGPGFGWAKAAFVNLAAAQAAAGARAATAKENALEQELRVRARATPDAEADFPGAEGAHSLKVSAAPDSLHAAASATTKGPEAAAGGRESKTKSKRKGERDRKLSGSARIRPPRPPLPSFPMPHHAFLSPHYGRGSLPSTARSSPNLQPHLVGQLEQGEPWGLLPQHQALLLGRRRSSMD
ncbi:hypothetical protein EBH_0024120 [Eimeria brunetti]|uniref:Uncharacterized protein n=1 Tax=Eimeria brunetti TaxID=51314 RepID=U6LMT1_9EIME|nr:hypothetical protein EBH_0024120 [Eimeria brunetti]